MPPTARRKSSKAAAIGALTSHVATADGADTPERRRLRNRMSQRAFRARQAMRIQELEERLEKAARPDVAWAMQLQDQNAQLREQLLQVYKKATSMQISMKALADAAAQALGIDVPTTCVATNEDSTSADTAHHSSSPAHSASQHSEATVDIDAVQDATNPPVMASDADIEELPFVQLTDFVPVIEPRNPSDHNVMAASTDSFLWPTPDLDFFTGLNETVQSSAPAECDRQLPSQIHRTGIVDFTQTPVPSLSLVPLSANNLGLEHYTDIRERATLFYNEMQTVRRTNSSFSDHIDAFEACLAGQRSRCGPVVIADKQLIPAIEFMIEAFVNISWTQMTGWETYTRSLTALKDLTAWRMDRTLPQWQKIVPQYRPTKLQVSVDHPSVIDWIPWPSLRDKLIIHHSANPRLDEIISDIGKAYVVQADLSTLVRCPRPIVGYVSVWALVQAITTDSAADAQQSSATGYPCINACGMGAQPFTYSTLQSQQIHPYPPPKLPASSANELFGSVLAAKAAHELLNIGRGEAFKYKLDPSFFEVYPELYDCKANIVAQGIRLRPDDHLANRPMPVPGPLEASIISQYQDFSKIALEYVAV